MALSSCFISSSSWAFEMSAWLQSRANVDDNSLYKKTTKKQIDKFSASISQINFRYKSCDTFPGICLIFNWRKMIKSLHCLGPRTRLSRKKMHLFLGSFPGNFIIMETSNDQNWKTWHLSDGTAPPQTELSFSHVPQNETWTQCCPRPSNVVNIRPLCHRGPLQDWKPVCS